MKQETIVKLFEALGFKTAQTWDEPKLQKKVKELPELVDGVKLKNRNAKRILKAILGAKEISIIPAGQKEEPERASETAMRKTAKKKVAKKKAPGKKNKTVKKGVKTSITKKAPKRLNRMAAVVEVLKKNKKISVKELIVAADRLYAENGGKKNQAEASYSVNKVLVTLQLIEYLTVEEGICQRL